MLAKYWLLLKKSNKIFALRLVEANDQPSVYTQVEDHLQLEEADEVLSIAMDTSLIADLKLTPIRNVSSNLNQDICDIAVNKNVDFIVMNAQKGADALFSSPSIKYALDNAKTTIGIFIDK